MLIYLIKEQGSFYDPKNLFTSNKELKHEEVIANIKKLYDVKFVDEGEFRIAINGKTHTIYFEKVKDPLKLFNIQHCD